MTECRALAATGMLGTGFLESSLEQALEWEPHFIGSDAGSTDGGPRSLGAGPRGSKDATRRDLRLMLKAGCRKKIPVLVGSAGGAGGNAHLEWTREIVAEIAKEEGLHFRAAFIRSEQSKEFLKKKLREGKIKPLKPAPEFTEQVISAMYNTPVEDVHLVNYDAGYAIKFTIPRPVFQGELEDTDLLGGQQYGPLVDLEVPD